ncbi:MAG: DNA primase [Candidatus Moranbacteria bacterium]|nr:DNA primase [Candidatus Moranbacteria bacterium]
MVNSVVDEIKSRLNIIDFIGQYLRLQKAGANFRALCPFHREKTPSFMVSEEKQIWHCFGCGKGGDIFGFLMEMEALDFKEALKVLADKAGVQLKEYRPEIAGSKNKILEILELATKFYETQLWKGMGKDKILNYLHERGLKDETIKEFRLGYAPLGWRNILKFLTERGYKIEDIAGTGLLVKKEENDKNSNATSYYDRFRDRIIFPISDALGKVVGFSARVSPGGDESQAKYVNTPETMVYHKSKILYGVDKAKKEIKEKNSAVLVEGNMDVIAASQAGIKNTVAVSGTALTGDQLDILKRYSENIIMLFDMDSAGEEAIARSSEICFQKGINARIVRLPEGKDAAELAKKDPQLFADSLKKSVSSMEYLLGKILARCDKTKAEGKKTIAKEALNLIRYFSSEIEKNHWIKKLARELEVEDKVLAGALGKTRAGRKTKEEEEKKEVTFQERADTIREKIVGLILAFPAVWNKVAVRYGDDDYLKDDEFLQILFRGGSLSDFKIENLLATFDDDDLKKLFRKLSFEAKYHFSEHSEMQEIDSDQAETLAEQYFAELKKEIGKKKLANIARDIRKAEEQGNKEELELLVKEFSKFSQGLDKDRQ